MESSAAPLSSSRCAQRDPRAYHRRPAIRTWRLIASLTFAAHLIITLVGSDTAQTTSTQSSASVKESAVVAKASSVSGSQVNESLSSNFDDDEDEDGNGGGDEEDIREPLNRTERTYVVYKTMSRSSSCSVLLPCLSSFLLLLLLLHGSPSLDMLRCVSLCTLVRRLLAFQANRRHLFLI